MDVVVTGAAGFIARHLVDALGARGHTVVGVDRHWGPTVDLLADLSQPPDTVADALRAADAVFHLAGCGGVRQRGPEADARWSRDNVAASGAVLALVPRATPVVVTSSSSVYGGTAGRPSREGDTLRPRGGYARSKVGVEELCGRRRADGGRVAVARPFTVAGEGQRVDMALHRWLSAAMAGEPIRVLGGLHRTRDVTDVRDVVRGLVTMVDREVDGVVNLGTGVPHALGELVDAVRAVAGAVEVVVDRSAPADDPDHTCADVTRCSEVLGFVPRTDLRELVARQAALVPAG